MTIKLLILFYFFFFSFLANCCNNNVVEKQNTANVAIESFLNQYERPFTFLDLSGVGNIRSFFSIARKYDAVFIMIDDFVKRSNLSCKHVIDLCKKSCLDNIILLDVDPVACLQRLSECEHFDVVLLRNVVSRFSNKSEQMINIALSMSDNVIVEVFCNNCDGKERVINYLSSKNAQLLERMRSSDIYLLENKFHVLKRKIWFTRLFNKNDYVITSNFKEKFLNKKVKREQVVSEWIQGINLVTFKMCRGIYPECETTKNSIIGLSGVEHNDWLPCNMVIQGRSVELIDFDDPRDNKTRRRLFGEKLLSKILKFVSIDDPKEAESFFWKGVIYCRKDCGK